MPETVGTIISGINTTGKQIYSGTLVYLDKNGGIKICETAKSIKSKKRKFMDIVLMFFGGAIILGFVGVKMGWWR